MCTHLPGIRHSQVSTLKAIISQPRFYFRNIWINIVIIMGSHCVYILCTCTLLLYWSDDGYTQPKHVAVLITDNCHFMIKNCCVCRLIYYYINVKCSNFFFCNKTQTVLSQTILQSFIFFSAYLFENDEQALPGKLQSSKRALCLHLMKINVVPHCTTSCYFFPSFSLQSS